MLGLRHSKYDQYKKYRFTDFLVYFDLNLDYMVTFFNVITCPFGNIFYCNKPDLNIFFNNEIIAIFVREEIFGLGISRSRSRFLKCKTPGEHRIYENLVETKVQDTSPVTERTDIFKVPLQKSPIGNYRILQYYYRLL